MATFVVRIVGYTYIPVKSLFISLCYARRGRFIYYIYINRVLNVARISRPKKTRESSKNKY